MYFFCRKIGIELEVANGWGRVRFGDKCMHVFLAVQGLHVSYKLLSKNVMYDICFVTMPLKEVNNQKEFVSNFILDLI